MSIAEFQLRQASLQDALELQRACWPNWALEAVKDLLRRVESMSQRGRGYGVVALRNDQIVGYGQLTVWPRTAEISDLIVAPDYRGQGIGSAIIQSLIEKVNLWHMPQVEIGVALSNPRALALYRRLGFEQDRIINLDLGDGPEPVMYLTMHFALHP
jgi:[ribosomal protein S18]-alanine N-acetyltransferase